MKKMIRKIFGIISSFILVTQSKIFAIEQTNVYGPPPEPNDIGTVIDRSQPALYGPAPDPSISSITGGHIFSFLALILLFIIGLIVILNKNIKKKIKVITITLFSIIIITLILLSKYFF